MSGLTIFWVISTTLLIFSFIFNFKPYSKGYKAGYRAGAEAVLKDWKEHIGMEDDK